MRTSKSPVQLITVPEFNIPVQLLPAQQVVERAQVSLGKEFTYREDIQLWVENAEEGEEVSDEVQFVRELWALIAEHGAALAYSMAKEKAAFMGIPDDTLRSAIFDLVAEEDAEEVGEGDGLIGDEVHDLLTTLEAEQSTLAI